MCPAFLKDLLYDLCLISQHCHFLFRQIADLVGFDNGEGDGIEIVSDIQDPLHRFIVIGIPVFTAGFDIGCGEMGDLAFELKAFGRIDRINIRSLKHGFGRSIRIHTAVFPVTIGGADLDPVFNRTVGRNADLLAGSGTGRIFELGTYIACCAVLIDCYRQGEQVFLFIEQQGFVIV